MRRISIIAAFAAVMLFSGCKIDGGWGFNPTKAGYEFTVNTASSIIESLNDISLLRHLDQYISADEEERLEIQDTYFYSMRIVEREDGEWHIIGNNEVAVLTDGRSLSEKGVKWYYYYYKGTYENGNFPSVENIADGDNEKYAYHIERGMDGKTIYRSDLTVEITPYEQTSNGQTTMQEYMDIEGEGEYPEPYYLPFSNGFSFRIISPLRYDTGKKIFTRGRLSMTATFDGVTISPESEFTEKHITVCGGKDNAYSEEYSHSSYTRY